MKKRKKKKLNLVCPKTGIANIDPKAKTHCRECAMGHPREEIEYILRPLIPNQNSVVRGFILPEKK